MAEIATQIETGSMTLGEITDNDDLQQNFSENAIPQNIAEVTAGLYPDFLLQRRALMAQTIRNYYNNL